MEPFQKKQRLMCTHAFCAACLERSVERLGLQCPVCQQALRVLGDQPEGQMTHETVLSMYILIITYTIPDGIQTEAHPNPGKPFTGVHTQSCLPDSPEGRRVLKLLQRAFEQKLILLWLQPMELQTESTLTSPMMHQGVSATSLDSCRD
ncbi:hypothetical protein COCON_G00236510 [Conger conger]|uniref:E3 ubiquitin-protein ligase n=1 Tax=Conger conger TaxID=82655 RepID=A0A9Q1HIF0_CONCO|nr:hypothetical protein COCON_G00236510 [Conger conger]